MIDFKCQISSKMRFLFQFERVTMSPYTSQFTNDRNMSANALSRYVKYMKLKARNPDSMMMPTHDILMVWISHMIRPGCYEYDCRSYFGISGKLPYPDTSLSVAQWTLKDESLYHLNELWLKEYNETYIKNADKIITPEESRNRRSKNIRFYRSHGNGRTDLRKGNPYIVEETNMEPLHDYQSPLKISVEDVMKDRDWMQLFMQYLNTFSSKYSVRIEYLHTGDSLPNEFVSSALKQYEKFLFLNAVHSSKSESFHPTYVIDLAWHAHMLQPNEYKEDCQKYLGRVLEHDPWPQKDMDSDYCMTKNMWQEEFRENMETMDSVNPYPTSPIQQQPTTKNRL